MLARVQELQERKKIKKKERKKKKKPESEAEAEAEADAAPAEASEAEPGEPGESSDEAAQHALSPEASPQDVAGVQKETAEAAAEAAAAGPDGESFLLCMLLQSWRSTADCYCWQGVRYCCMPIILMYRRDGVKMRSMVLILMTALNRERKEQM